MSLVHATLPDGQPNPITTDGPVDAWSLGPLAGVPFQLPCEDPWLLARSGPAATYLDAAASAWDEHPEHMDFLDMGSPIWDLKRAERDLYLHWWRPFLKGTQHILDLGSGIGRMTQPMLDRGKTVWAVDGDHESLRRCVWHAAGRPGKLSVHWSTVHTLPETPALDAIIACEVLCYVPDLERVLGTLFARLRPGGALLLAMEGRYGWACAEDAPMGGLDNALGEDATLYIEGDRYVRTFAGPTLTQLLTDAGFVVPLCVPTHYLTDGPLEGLLPDDLSLETLLSLEDRCRAHPVWSPLNRIWTVAAVKPPE